MLAPDDFNGLQRTKGAINRKITFAYLVTVCASKPAMARHLASHTFCNALEDAAINYSDNLKLSDPVRPLKLEALYEGFKSYIKQRDGFVVLPMLDHGYGRRGHWVVMVAKVIRDVGSVYVYDSVGKRDPDERGRHDTLAYAGALSHLLSKLPGVTRVDIYEDVRPQTQMNGFACGFYAIRDTLWQLEQKGSMRDVPGGDSDRGMRAMRQTVYDTLRRFW